MNRALQVHVWLFCNFATLCCVAAENLSPATIFPTADFDPSADAFLLRNATKDTGTDEIAIIQLLTKRSNEQRQIIMKRYFDDYNRDLLQDLRSELSSELKNILVHLMYPPVGFLTMELHRSLNAFPKDTNAITEILVTRNITELIQLKSMYLKMFNKPLVDQISTIRFSSLYYKHLITNILMGYRQAENETDPVQAKQHASILYYAGEGQRGTSEDLINKVLGHESYEQLRLVLREYKTQFGKTVEQSLRRELSGDLLRIHLAILDYIQSPLGYYAKQLYRAMRGPGTDDATLMRILISRSEIDLREIRREFERRYEYTLKSAIEWETHGYYKVALLALLGFPG